MSLKAILFDLDDTLLATNMDRFIPKYLDALGNKMKSLMKPKKLIDLVLKSTQVMMESQEPALTNEQVFYDHFYSKIDFSKSDFHALIKEFYDVDFPKLKIYTEPIPSAVDIVQIVFDADLKVVIATNPLFPARAIEHRIDWAGLSGFTFDLVTTYENSHFCKPNPNYYWEILEKIEIDPDDALMVGNDLINDIEPAASLGLDTFYINSKFKLEKSGTIDHFTEWIKEIIK